MVRSLCAGRLEESLLWEYGDDPIEEYLHFYCLGIDGLFSDSPDSAVTAKALFANAPREVCKPWR